MNNQTQWLFIEKLLLSAYKQYDRSIWKLNIEFNLYFPALIYCFINIRLTLVFVDFIIDSNDYKLMFIKVKKIPINMYSIWYWFCTWSICKKVIIIFLQTVYTTKKFVSVWNSRACRPLGKPFLSSIHWFCPQEFWMGRYCK